MGQKIIITGATGLIGKKITQKLADRGDEVTVFSRSPDKARKAVPHAANYVEWDYNDISGWKDSLEGKDGVIHLAGENIFGRWTDEKKSKIEKSRVKGTRALVEAIAQTEKKPKVFVCASASGYYGSSQVYEFTEDSQPGNDFLAKVTALWEDEATAVEKYGVRRASIRTGVVLSTKGGALKLMLIPFTLYAGGYIGSGEQWFPWIHIDDIADIYLYALDNNSAVGPLNAVAPHTVTMKKFTRELGKVMDRPALFSVPESFVRLILAEGADAVTGGAKILPKKTRAIGYKFSYPRVDEALENLLRAKK